MILMIFLHGAKHGVQRVCVQTETAVTSGDVSKFAALLKSCSFDRLRHAPDTPRVFSVLCGLGPGVKYCSHWQSSCASGIM